MLSWHPDLPDRRTMAAADGETIYLALPCPGGWKGMTNHAGNVRDLRPEDRRAYPTRKAAMAACERHAGAA